MAAHIPLFLYPFLHTVSKTRPFEYLRLTSLGVIGKICLSFVKSIGDYGKYGTTGKVQVAQSLPYLQYSINFKK